MGPAHHWSSRRRSRPSSASVARTWSWSTSGARRSRACPARASSTCSSRPSPTTSRRSRRCCCDLGFGPQPGDDPFPPTRPLLVGSLVVEGTTFKIHCHVQPRGEEMVRDLAFRDALRADPELVKAYAELKSEIVAGGYHQTYQYTYRKQAWIADVHRRLGVRRRPIGPPATIGILGGGQLGRMLAQAARSMGYRVAVLDPDPDCPAAAVADRPDPRLVRRRRRRTPAGRCVDGRDLRTRARRVRGGGCPRSSPARPAGSLSAGQHAGPDRRTSVRRTHRGRRRAVARGPNHRRAARRCRRPGPAAPAQGGDRRVRRSRPDPDRDVGRDRRRAGAPRPAGRRRPSLPNRS